MNCAIQWKVLGMTAYTSAAEQESLARFWPAVAANLSFPSSLVPLLLSSLHSSSPVHSFPVSSCACRRSCDDESVAAVCLCVWHRDVSLLALTPSRSLSTPHPPRSLLSSLSSCRCLSVFFPLSCSLSFSYSQWLGIAWPPASVMEQTEHTDPTTTTTNRNWAPRFAHWFLLGAFLK